MATGASDHAIGFASLQDLDRAEAALQCLEGEMQGGERPLVTVVGAGYAGALFWYMMAATWWQDAGRRGACGACRWFGSRRCPVTTMCCKSVGQAQREARV